MPELRPFQLEDFNQVLEAHQTYQRVIGRAATGLGKAVICAALAEKYAERGRRERIATTCEQRATAAIEGGIHAIETLFLGEPYDKTPLTLGFPEVSSLSLTREGGNHE